MVGIKEKVEEANKIIVILWIASVMIAVAGLLISAMIGEDAILSILYCSSLAIIIGIVSVAFAIINHAEILVIANNPEIELGKKEQQ